MKHTIRFFTPVFIGVCLMVPALARADTYSVETIIALTSPAINWTVLAGSVANSLAVNAGSVAVTVSAGSAFTMTSVSRSFTYTGQTADAVVNVSCSGDRVAKIEISSTNPSSQTLTIAPGDTQCGSGSSGGGSPIVAPPQDTAVTLNGGDEITVGSDVTLTLGALGASEMRVANTPAFTAAEWEPYTLRKAWRLTKDPGLKTVYAQFRNQPDNFSHVVSDSIRLIAHDTRASEPPPLAQSPRPVTIPPAIPALQAAAPCPPYLKKHIKFGETNDHAEVERLQTFLQNEEGYQFIQTTGTYDQETFQSVIAFQERYREDVLAPWGEAAGTGYVYLTTRKKINQLHCARQARESAAKSAGKRAALFGRDLARGDIHGDVKRLQIFLNQNGFPVAASGPGSPGHETDMFGARTEQALRSFQRKYSDKILVPAGLIEPTGALGPHTRRFINERAED